MVPKRLFETYLLGAKIYYTTDGNDPTAASAVYTGPIQIPSTAATLTIKAKAMLDTWVSSVVQTATFQYGALPLTSLIGYWNFDDLVGSDVSRDCSGNMNDGASQGATSIAGVFNTASHYDGQSKIVIGKSGETGVLETIADMTLSMFVKLDNPNNGNAYKILSNKPSSDAETGYELRYNSTSKKLSFITTPEDFCLSKALNVEDGIWHHIGFTLKETTCRFYIDR
jgi:hypothetical protein